MRIFFIILILIVFNTRLQGQTSYTNLKGKVSFVSSQNVYVKFSSTDGISPGDTLFSQTGEHLTPVLIVNNMSSLSVLSTPLSEVKLNVADNIIARTRSPQKDASKANFNPAEKNTSINTPAADSTTSGSEKNKFGGNERKQMIKGSTSISSYTDNSNTSGPNSQRFRYTLSLDAENIGDSKFSVETYFSIKYKAGEWDLVKNDIFSALKIYNLALRYSPDKTMQISLGRRINPHISSIGASDGLQFEKSFNRLTVGAIAGSRPDYATYGFNFNLLQYGAFVAYGTKSAGSYSETSMAFMEQMNSSRTDRRFLYFQHSSSPVRNLSLFGTFEVDLYKLTIDSLSQEKSKNTLDLTSLYLSVSYRFGRFLSISGSYDARKNVMYYETYKTYLNRILEDQLRQGYRVNANAHITRDLMLGVQTGYRFLKSDPHPSKNISGYVTYTTIPGINMSGTLSATYIESAYMNGNIYGLNLSRDFLNGKFQTGLGYQYVEYRMPENQMNILQHIGDINFSWQISGKMFFSVYYEGTLEKSDNYNRLYLQLRKRF